MRFLPVSSRTLRACPLMMAAALVLPVRPLAAQTPAPAASASASPAATPTPAPSAKPARTAESAVTPVDRNPNRHAQFLYRIKEGKVGLLFLGDSIMDYWPRIGEASWLKYAPYDPADFGVGGERTEDVLWRITNGELDGIAPKVAVVMIGTNNTGAPGEEPAWIAAGVKKIVETVHAKLPQTKVLLLAVFPRGGKSDAVRGEIDKINAEVARLDDGKTTRFLDLGHVFLDDKGELPRDVMPDRLHPSAKGYDLWYDAMRPTLDEMMK